MQVQYAARRRRMKIQINQCRPAFDVEIFSCEVVSKKVSFVKNDKNGTQRFQFKDAGFYLFDKTIVQKTQSPQKYRVV